MADVRAEFDRHMMAIALSLARRGLGRTAPNPSVGAVIADEIRGEIIARGLTRPGGRPHAETEALNAAGARARGATMYVTLEPCSHQGVTPPCADAVLAGGIARLVCATEDPDPRVGGRGLEKLRAAGIAVERGLMGAEARWVAMGHILRIVERRPFIQFKIAVGPDGRVPRGARGHPAWVSGPEALARGHLLRAEADAILVGRQTVIDDDPQLTCRLPGMAARSPVRVVLSTRGAGLDRTRLATTARQSPLWIFSGPDGEGERWALEACGARLFSAPVIGGGLWLPAVMETLAAEGITRLLVEGGPMIWHAFAAAGLVDEVVLFHARSDASVLRKEAAAAVLQQLVPVDGLELSDHRRLVADDMLVFRRRGAG